LAFNQAAHVANWRRVLYSHPSPLMCASGAGITISTKLAMILLGASCSDGKPEAMNFPIF
jgi:hypothetical protein